MDARRIAGGSMSTEARTDPMPSEDRFAELMALVKLLGEPGAAEKRIAELRSAASEARAAIEEALRLGAQTKAEKEASDAAIASAKSKHEAKVAADRSAFDIETAQQRARLEQREFHVSVQEDNLDKQEREAKAKLAEIQRRLDASKTAAAA
jgi:hypothetical protein